MNSVNPNATEPTNAFGGLFNLDVRVEAAGKPIGRCNSTDDGCSSSCTSVGCSTTCNCK